jgi:hypothetical protein
MSRRSRLILAIAAYAGIFARPLAAAFLPRSPWR